MTRPPFLYRKHNHFHTGYYQAEFLVNRWLGLKPNELRRQDQPTAPLQGSSTRVE